MFILRISLKNLLYPEMEILPDRTLDRLMAKRLKIDGLGKIS